MRFTATCIESGLLGVALLASLAWAHTSGFHKRLLFTVGDAGIDALVVMDVDGGERVRLIRAGADTDHDGALSADEALALKGRLVSMATRALTVHLSRAPVSMLLRDSKLDLRGDLRAESDTAVSVAVLMRPRDVIRAWSGLELQVSDAAPDGSPIVVEVFQTGDERRKLELPSNGTAAVRLR